MSEPSPSPADTAIKPLRSRLLSGDSLALLLLLFVVVLYIAPQVDPYFHLPKGWAVLLATLGVAASLLTTVIAKVAWGWGGGRFQFSFRTLLFMTAIIGITCGWFAVEWRNAQRQNSAIDAINGVGGSTSYRRPIGHQLRPIEHYWWPFPEWLGTRLGQDFFDDRSEEHTSELQSRRDL